MSPESFLRITAQLENLSVVRRFVRETAVAFGVVPDAIPDVLLAVDEAVTNIIVHGYKDQAGTIEVEVRLEVDSLVVSVRDEAPSFDPTTVPSPDLSLPLEQRRLGGMGIYMMRQITDELTHRIIPQGGNELTIVKRQVV